MLASYPGVTASPMSTCEGSGPHTAAPGAATSARATGFRRSRLQPEPPIFPWSSIEELDEQLEAEGEAVAIAENRRETALVTPD